MRMAGISSEGLISELSKGIRSAAELKAAFGVSQSSLWRSLRPLIQSGQAAQLGVTRGARYALRRTVADIGSAWPLYRIGRQGEIDELGTVNALAADQYFVDAIATSRALGNGGVTDGLPYFLQDQRPGGFLGRAVPTRYPELRLPPRVVDWSDEHYLRYLTRHGSDTAGDLILGESALNEYLAGRDRHISIGGTEREDRYPKLATEVMEGGLPGSSAHGEHPKFLAAITTAAAVRHVLVKFSPPIETALGLRWADLLIGEHHAHSLLRKAGLPACESRIFKFEDRASAGRARTGRVFLEVDRFDREGEAGRIGVTSLMAISLARHGELDDWISAGRRLHAEGRIDAPTLEQVRLVATFGELIANTDRHFGNLAFYDDYSDGFSLAPVYDMLPMLFAPQNDQIVARVFKPPEPTANSHRVWARARDLAESYWQALSEDPGLSAEFRTLCAACLGTLQRFPRTGAYAGSRAYPGVRALHGSGGVVEGYDPKEGH